MGRGGEHPKPEIPVVAIVGLGPRGLYCLEALVAEYKSRPLRTGLHVAIFNKTYLFGASPVYDLDQPPYLLINIRARDLNLWNPNAAKARFSGPEFTQWHYTEFQPPTPMDPDTSPPRSVVGHYLARSFQRITSRLPAGMRLSKFAAEVTDIAPVKDGYRLRFSYADGRQDNLVANKVLLTTGHSWVRPARKERSYLRFADRHPGTNFISQAYPVSEALDGISTQDRVAMKGIGLTFIDAVLALTEGRGGVFERKADGQLVYKTSGREPKTIVPFSRTGLPTVPRSWDFPSSLRPLTFVIPARLEELRDRSPGGKLDLDRDIWPLVELEMERRYYQVAMGEGAGRRALEECGADVRAMRQVICGFRELNPQLAPFDYHRALDPVSAHPQLTGAQYNAFIENYMRREIDYARAGLATSPTRAAISMWFEVRAALKPFVVNGGLTPESHRRLIETYFPLFKRVAFGPPIVNVEKLLALHRAGLLDFSMARNPRVIMRESAGCFELRLPAPASRSAQIDILVDARFPTAKILRDAAPLYQSLRRRKMIREFENISPEDARTTYPTGAIDMEPNTQYVIDQHGVPNNDIAVCGVPTEGNLIGTFMITRDGYETVWAADIMRQLRSETGGRGRDARESSVTDE